MKMHDLLSYGFSQELIEIWSHEESEELLPIQARAIQEYAVLEGASGNLLIVAPTSSGKTFIGELAAVREALQMKKAVFLVPFRAIAEELFVNFTGKYQKYGLRIVISDRDHREYDEDIVNGSYDIAVMVYEKLTGLLVVNPELFSGCGLVIADEVQMMTDRDRGPTIELLLTKLLLSPYPIRVMALSAVLDRLNEFDTWLRARVLSEKCRPVELREGIYTREGIVKYREFNSKKTGTRTLGAWDRVEEGMLNLIQSFIDQNEQTLVFCSTRPATIETARMIADNLSRTSPAVQTINRANDLPDSTIREEIQNLLQSSVAYHNSDLTPDERRIIEEGFRNKEVKAIVCTSTLAMGVNVPARNVIVYDPNKWDGNMRQFVPISVAEYKNMVGRAGRYSTGDPYGCSYLLALNRANADAFGETYVRGELEGFASQFGDQAVDSQVLEIVAGDLADSQDRIREMIFSTYNGQHKWKTSKSRAVIDQLIAEAVERCLEYGAISSTNSGRLKVTPQGRVCAAGGYSLEHLRAAIDYLSTNRNDVDASVIYWALETDAASSSNAYHIGRLRTLEYRSGKYQRLLAQLAEERQVGQMLNGLAEDPDSINYDQCVILRRCLACCGWISPTATHKLERTFSNVTIGSIRNTAEVCAWLISLLAELSRQMSPNDGRGVSLEELVDRLSYGATKDALGLCRIRGAGLSRDERNHLIENGIRSIDDVLSASSAKLPLPRKKALRLAKAAESTIEDGAEKRKRLQQTRLNSLGIDVSGVVNLYEKEGTQLENAIDDVLKTPFFELTCLKVTKQNEGEPDHLIYDRRKKIYVVQTTARERKNIAMTKATSVVGQSSKYKPEGYIVFGRPDFESLAIRDSQNQIRAGRNYKLIPITVLAEMLVLFHEKKIAAADVERILIDEKGYFGLSELSDYVRRLSKGQQNI